MTGGHYCTASDCPPCRSCEHRISPAEMMDRVSVLEAQLAEAQNRLSDGIAFAFNMMEPRTVEDTRDTLDEQLSVLEESYKARGAALATEKIEVSRLIRSATALSDKLAAAQERECKQYDCPHWGAEILRLRSDIAAEREEIERLREERDSFQRVGIDDALRARDEGRVERAAREMYNCCSDGGGPWDERTSAVHSVWSDAARAVLAAADGAERGGR